MRDFAPTLSCISAPCPTMDMLWISPVCITPSYRLQKTPLYNRLATFPLRLGSGNPSATSRETIPTMGPDSHVPSTPSVKDVTSCGGYHRITTVRLKSQADETQPSTPIGRTPEEREIAGTVCLFIRPQEYQSGPAKRPKSPSHKRLTPRGADCPLILKHLYNTEKPWRVPKNALGLLLLFLLPEYSGK